MSMAPRECPCRTRVRGDRQTIMILHEEKLIRCMVPRSSRRLRLPKTFKTKLAKVKREEQDDATAGKAKKAAADDAKAGNTV